MSVDIDWNLITSGPDGEALAESIRAFIHAKFQQIALPRFINTVHVHSFSFGSVCPQIEIKDICDPLPDFYEDEDSDQPDPPDTKPSRDADDVDVALTNGPISVTEAVNSSDLHDRVAALQTAGQFSRAGLNHWPAQQSPLTHGDSHHPSDTLSGHFARSGTPGIPGGTSNMSYFHFPMAGLSGAQTPLAAVAGGGPFGTHAWLNDQYSRRMGLNGTQAAFDAPRNQHEAQSGGKRRTGSIPSPDLGSPMDPSSPEKKPHHFASAEKVSDEISSGVLTDHEPQTPVSVSPTDLQVVARVSYNGDVQMMLTAEVMLDYPMPSFIKIPLKMSITGVAFDGVAIVAYIKKNMHFCFLDPEDAETLVGSSIPSDIFQSHNSTGKKTSIGGLLREIRVETEIGRQESGKQVLKNVGKVERFVLEQVRRIFEDEFVFPSFWTFLV